MSQDEICSETSLLCRVSSPARQLYTGSPIQRQAAINGYVCRRSDSNMSERDDTSTEPKLHQLLSSVFVGGAKRCRALRHVLTPMPSSSDDAGFHSQADCISKIGRPMTCWSERAYRAAKTNGDLQDASFNISNCSTLSEEILNSLDQFMFPGSTPVESHPVTSSSVPIKPTDSVSSCMCQPVRGGGNSSDYKTQFFSVDDKESQLILKRKVVTFEDLVVGNASECSTSDRGDLICSACTAVTQYNEKHTVEINNCGSSQLNTSLVDCYLQRKQARRYCFLGVNKRAKVFFKDILKNPSKIKQTSVESVPKASSYHSLTEGFLQEVRSLHLQNNADFLFDSSSLPQTDDIPLELDEQLVSSPDNEKRPFNDPSPRYNPDILQEESLMWTSPTLYERNLCSNGYFPCSPERQNIGWSSNVTLKRLYPSYDISVESSCDYISFPASRSESVSSMNMAPSFSGGIEGGDLMDNSPPNGVLITESRTNDGSPRPEPDKLSEAQYDAVSNQLLQSSHTGCNYDEIVMNKLPGNSLFESDLSCDDGESILLTSVTKCSGADRNNFKCADTASSNYKSFNSVNFVEDKMLSIPITDKTIAVVDSANGEAAIGTCESVNTNNDIHSHQPSRFEHYGLCELPGRSDCDEQTIEPCSSLSARVASDRAACRLSPSAADIDRGAESCERVYSFRPDQVCGNSDKICRDIGSSSINAPDVNLQDNINDSLDPLCALSKTELKQQSDVDCLAESQSIHYVNYYQKSAENVAKELNGSAEFGFHKLDLPNVDISQKLSDIINTSAEVDFQQPMSAIPTMVQCGSCDKIFDLKDADEPLVSSKRSESESCFVGDAAMTSLLQQRCQSQNQSLKIKVSENPVDGHCSVPGTDLSTDATSGSVADFSADNSVEPRDGPLGVNPGYTSFWSSSNLSSTVEHIVSAGPDSIDEQLRNVIEPIIWSQDCQLIGGSLRSLSLDNIKSGAVSILGDSVRSGGNLLQSNHNLQKVDGATMNAAAVPPPVLDSPILAPNTTILVSSTREQSLDTLNNNHTRLKTNVSRIPLLLTSPGSEVGGKSSSCSHLRSDGAPTHKRQCFSPARYTAVNDTLSPEPASSRSRLPRPVLASPTALFHAVSTLSLPAGVGRARSDRSYRGAPSLSPTTPNFSSDEDGHSSGAATVLSDSTRSKAKLLAKRNQFRLDMERKTQQKEQLRLHGRRSYGMVNDGGGASGVQTAVRKVNSDATGARTRRSISQDRTVLPKRPAWRGLDSSDSVAPVIDSSTSHLPRRHPAPVAGGTRASAVVTSTRITKSRTFRSGPAETTPTVAQGSAVNLFEHTMGAFEDPRVALGDVYVKLAAPDWEVIVAGLTDIVRLVRYHPSTVSCDIKAITTAVVQQCRNLRSQVMRAAIQTADQMFEHMGRAMEPEMSSLVEILLHRTGDTNRFIRSDSLHALETMLERLSPARAINVITQYGVSHRNSQVRCTAARLLCQLVSRLGVQRSLAPLPYAPGVTGASTTPATSPPGGVCLAAQLVPAAVQLVRQGDLHTRKYAKRIFQVWLQHPDLERILARYLSDGQQRDMAKLLESIQNESQKASAATPGSRTYTPQHSRFNHTV